jgi:hypothetical protein
MTITDDKRKERIKKILFDITDILTRNNITYWLDYGTLLGAVRNTQIIFWDNDCDVCIFEEDRERVNALAEDIGKLGLKLHMHAFKDSGFQIKFDGNANFHSEHMDIFCWCRDGDILRRRFYIGLDSPTGTDTKKGKDFPVKWVEPLSTITLEGRKFPCPNNPKEFCAFRYGPFWQTPMTIMKWNRATPTPQEVYAKPIEEPPKTEL